MTAEPLDVSAATIEASIVICTFNRLPQLAKAVKSCIAQVASLRFEVIVVDNSADSNAANLISELARHDPRVRYVPSLIPNIALARNAGVAHARGEFVAFLDDDEEASPNWLQNLVETLRDTGADCSYGPIWPRFEGGLPPSWDPEGWWYTRYAGFATGTDYAVVRRERMSRAGIGTGNSIIRVESCAMDREPFDPSYGRTGAEDTDFFDRMIRRGRRIVWCRTADVWEDVPVERTEFNYFLARVRLSARQDVQIACRSSGRPRLTRMRFVASGLMRICLFGALYLVMPLRSWEAVYVRRGFNRGIGFISVGPLQPAYGESLATRLARRDQTSLHKS